MMTVRAHAQITFTKPVASASCFLTGTVLRVDQNANTANVRIEPVNGQPYELKAVPIFYHCECTETTRKGWAAITSEEEYDASSGAAAWIESQSNKRDFAGPSQVLVLKEPVGGNQYQYKIMAYADGVPRVCFRCGGFSFGSPAQDNPCTPGVKVAKDGQTIPVEVVGGCPTWKWTADTFEGALHRDYYFKQAETSQRTNELVLDALHHEISNNMAMVEIEDGHLNKAKCYVIVQCPDSAGIIVETIRDEPTIKWISFRSTDSKWYIWTLEQISGDQVCTGQFINLVRSPTGFSTGNMEYGNSHVTLEINLSAVPECDSGSGSFTVRMLCATLDWDEACHDVITNREMAAEVATGSKGPAEFVGGEITYNTDTQACGSNQTLTVSGGGSGPFTWSKTGGGTLSSTTGSSVTLTAPGSNPNCTENATITVTDQCGREIDSVDIAFNCYGNCRDGVWADQAYNQWWCEYHSCVNILGGAFGVCNYTIHLDRYCCDGSVWPKDGYPQTLSCVDQGALLYQAGPDVPACLNVPGCPDEPDPAYYPVCYLQSAFYGGSIDCMCACTKESTYYADIKDDGCCPAALL